MELSEAIVIAIIAFVASIIAAVLGGIFGGKFALRGVQMTLQSQERLHTEDAEWRYAELFLREEIRLLTSLISAMTDYHAAAVHAFQARLPWTQAEATLTQSFLQMTKLHAQAAVYLPAQVDEAVFTWRDSLQDLTESVQSAEWPKARIAWQQAGENYNTALEHLKLTLNPEPLRRLRKLSAQAATKPDARSTES